MCINLLRMTNNSAYIRFTWIILGMIFLVILAGGTVRMTQSGMGCPDWPKCFGRWIPPWKESQLPANFEQYLSLQDIDHTFNPYHTWIEYINRLLSAILGVLVLIHVVWSFKKFFKTRPFIAWTSFAMLLAVIFQAWLGKEVVAANLSAVKVTTHMVMALLISVLPLLIISRLKGNKVSVGRDVKSIATIALIIVLLQVIFGTQVREQVDEVSRALAYGQRESWLGMLDDRFIIHRSFSWLVAIIIFFLGWRSRIYPGLKRIRITVVLSFLITFFTGLIMYFFEMPAIAQPLHLLMGSLLFVSLAYYRLHLK